MRNVVVLACIVAMSSTKAVYAQQSAFTKLLAKRELVVSPAVHDLTNVGFISWARTGEIAIGQPQDFMLRYYGSDGLPTGKFGRSGEGPGEFRSMMRAGWLGDTLWVYDHILRRVTLVAPDRKLLRSFAITPNSKLSSGVDFMYGTVAAVLANGDLEMLGIIEVPLRSGLARVNPTSGRGTLIWSDSLAACSTDLPGGKSFAQPFCPRGASRTPPQGGGLVAVRQTRQQQERGEFSVARIGAGAFTRSYKTDTPALRRSVVDSVLDDLIRKASLSSTEAALVRSKVPKPSRYPAATMAVAGRDGSIFVGHSGPVMRRWTVIKNDGSVAGEFDLPKETVIHAVTLQSFWAAEVDVDGVQTPVRYRLSARK